MIGFEYKYTTSAEIFNNIKLLIDYSIIEYAILTISIILLIIFTYYIIPILNIINKQRKIKKEEDKKKNMLKSIMIQNKINQEIEKEINFH